MAVRIESDSMERFKSPPSITGEPKTERSLHHFAISDETMPVALIRSFGVLKLASGAGEPRTGQT